MCTHPQIEQQITFFYTHNLHISTEFSEQMLGLKLWLDQGTCRIYTVSGSGYLEFCCMTIIKSHVPFLLSIYQSEARDLCNHQ
ncbi:MAG: hypothetical protein V7K55_08875 [Nostoc sp.]|uniref:hypothetical protein n=1 Tax=Nostoc sp. TaxID=1180 RepID=UPI002FF84738